MKAKGLTKAFSSSGEAGLIDRIIHYAGGKENVAKITGNLIKSASETLAEGGKLDKETRENLNRFITILVKHEERQAEENIYVIPKEELDERFKAEVEPLVQAETRRVLDEFSELLTQWLAAIHAGRTAEAQGKLDKISDLKEQLLADDD